MTSRWLPWLRPAECVPTGLERGDDPRGCREHFASLVERSPLPSNDTTPRRADDVIDGVILVHYSRAPCRLRFQLAMLRRAGLPWQPPRLQLASQHDVEDFAPGFVRRCVSRRFCTDEELSQASCTANHVHAWHLALRLGWEATLVLEDDATLPRDARAMLQRRVEALPPGWTILNFACAGMERVRGCREGEGGREREREREAREGTRVISAAVASVLAHSTPHSTLACAFCPQARHRLPRLLPRLRALSGRRRLLRAPCGRD